MTLLAISTAVLAMISCVAVAPIPSHDQASVVGQASIFGHASLGARHESADGNLPITTSDGLGTAKVGFAATWLQQISHPISSRMRRTDILSFESERRAKGKETKSKSKAVKELPQANAFDGRPCLTIKQMSEHRPDGCLDANGKMYKSADVQNPEKAKTDTEGWKRLMYGADNSSAKEDKKGKAGSE